MPIDTGESAFKALFNRQNTNDPPAKQYYEENGRAALKVKTSEVWADAIDGVDPAVDVTNGVAELRTLFALSEDVTVPGSATWVADDGGTRLTNWMDVDDGDPTVNPFVSPYRVRIFDGADAEVFLTDPSQPFWNGKQGILRFGGPVTRPTPFKVTAHRYIGRFADQAINEAGGDTSTEITTALVIPVDQGSGTSVAVPPGTVFDSPSAVTLALGGAPAFNDLQAVFDTFVGTVINGVNVDIQCVGEVLRPPAVLPDGGESAWHVRGFELKGTGKLRVFGSTTYTPIVGPLTVLSHVPWVFGVSEPSVTFAGTPFAGLDLTGRFFETSDGAFSIIVSNTDDTIFTQSPVAPLPTDGVSTASVSRPSSILRNSYDDIAIAAPASTLGGVVHVEHQQESQFEKVEFWHFQIDDFGGDNFQLGNFFQPSAFGSYLSLNRCLVDYEYQNVNFGILPNASIADMRVGENGGLELIECGSYVNVALENRPDEPVASFSTGGPGDNQIGTPLLYLQGTVIAGGEDGIFLGGNERFTFFYSALKRLGDAGGSNYAINSKSWFDAANFSFAGFGGARNLIADTLGRGMIFASGAKSIRMGMYFENVALDCVEIQDGCDVKVGAPSGFNDEGFKNTPTGGNGAYGVHMVGIRSNALIGVNSDVSGASGDVTVQGTDYTYAFLTANSPVEATGFNLVSNT